MFRIPWKHAGKQDYNQEVDASIFKVGTDGSYLFSTTPDAVLPLLTVPWWEMSVFSVGFASLTLAGGASPCNWPLLRVFIPFGTVWPV